MKDRFMELALYTGLVFSLLIILKVQYTGIAYPIEVIEFIT